MLTLLKPIPFDDRANTEASLNNISFTLLKEHLRISKSKLLEWVETHSKVDILSQMELLSGPPEKFFPCSRVEIVFFPKGPADPEFREIPPITGTVPHMIKETLSYLQTHLLEEKIRKVSGQAEAMRVWNYPYAALEEVVVNSLFHRDYQVREPVEIRIYPDSITILNYGGPDRSIKIKAFEEGVIKPRRYRNRRLGDFLKELDLTEGRATGIPTIRKALMKNGSPLASFETDEDRSFFEVTIPIHPVFNIEKEKGQEKVGEKVGENLTVNQRGIITAMRGNPYISAPEIAKIIDISERKTETNIAKLKKMDLIKRIGPAKGGYWEIVVVT